MSWMNKAPPSLAIKLFPEKTIWSQPMSKHYQLNKTCVGIFGSFGIGISADIGTPFLISNSLQFINGNFSSLAFRAQTWNTTIRLWKVTIYTWSFGCSLAGPTLLRQAVAVIFSPLVRHGSASETSCPLSHPFLAGDVKEPADWPEKQKLIGTLWKSLPGRFWTSKVGRNAAACGDSFRVVQSSSSSWVLDQRHLSAKLAQFRDETDRI